MRYKTDNSEPRVVRVLLTLTLRVSGATKMSRVQQGVSEYQSYSLSRQSRLLALYNKIKILNQILNVVGNMEYHCLDQEVTQLQLPVLVLATCRGAA